MVFDGGRAEIPAGKVSRTVIEPFIDAQQLPRWASIYGAVSNTEMHSISDGRGEFELQVTGGEGGIKISSVDTDSFREIRVGCAMRLELPDGQDQLTVGFSSSQESLHSTQGAAAATQASRDDAAHVQYRQPDSSSTADAYFDLMRGPQILEFRVRPYEHGFTVAMGSGDDIVFEETAAEYQFDAAVHPMIGITTKTDAPGTLWLSRLWFELYHN